MQSAVLIPPDNQITSLGVEQKGMWSQGYWFSNLEHPEGTSYNPDIFNSIQKFWLQFTMVVYEKIYLGA